MDESNATRLRWSFSLRTLFVVMTAAVTASWLGWQLHVIHARKAFLAKLRAQAIVCGAHPGSNLSRDTGIEDWDPRLVRIPVPRVRIWLGDESFDLLEFSYVDLAIEDEARQLFPEAKVTSFDNPFGFPSEQSGNP